MGLLRGGSLTLGRLPFYRTTSGQAPYFALNRNVDSLAVYILCHLTQILFMPRPIEPNEVAIAQRYRRVECEVTGQFRATGQIQYEARMAKYVRYAWQDYFTPGLFNAYGLPAGPFRTDSFPVTTAPTQP